MKYMAKVVDDVKGCQKVEGRFVFGPQLCGIATKIRVSFDNVDWFPVCKDHLEEVRRNA